MPIYNVDETAGQEVNTSAGTTAGANLGNIGTGNNVSNLNALFNQGVSNPVDNSLGFVGLSLDLMSSARGSELTVNLSKEIAKVYKELPEDKRPRVHVLDREIVNNIAYSLVVVSKMVGSTVLYYTILLEATGRQASTAVDLMGEWNAEFKQGKVTNIFTPDLAVDSELHVAIVMAIANNSSFRITQDQSGTPVSIQDANGKDIEFTNLDGLVIYNIPEDVPTIARTVASIAFNACAVQAAMLTKQVSDFTISKGRETSEGKQLAIKSHSVTNTVNEIGDPVRSDFTLSLVLESKKNKETSINIRNNDIVIAKVSGFVDSIAEEVDVPTYTQYGYQNVKKVTLRPNIIVNSNFVATPTYGHMILGLITALTMAKKEMWVPTLVPRENGNQVGALNVITGVGTNPGEQAVAIDLKNKKYTAEEVHAIIQAMYTLDPIFSVDVDMFGPSTYYTSILSLAAAPLNISGREEALRELVSTLTHVTSGHFPATYDINRIFLSSGIMVPTGVWMDQTGLRDLKDIDAKFVASKSNDIALIRQWIMSNIPGTANTGDPYTTKLDVISKIVPNAIIRGKAARITFTSEFIATLTNAVTAAGLAINMTPEFRLLDANNNNFSMVNSYIKDAGINNIGNYTRLRSTTNPNAWSTPYAVFGGNRFQ